MDEAKPGAEQETSPYATPAADIQTESATATPVPASAGRRFSNYLIDVVVTIVFGILIELGFVYLLSEEINQSLQAIPDFVVGSMYTLIYYLVMEGMFGVSIGKLLTGTRVVNEAGQPPSFNQVLGRSFTRLVPFEAFSFLGETRRGWHDSWSNTYVIYKHDNAGA